MNKEIFSKDTKKLYTYLADEKNKINELFDFLAKGQEEKLGLIEDFKNFLELPSFDGLQLALMTRLVNLRADSLIQVLQKNIKDEAKITELEEKAYIFVRDFWQEKHKETINFLENNKLLTPFYREIMKGTYEVGVKFSLWQSAWTKQIVNTTNHQLSEDFKHDNKKIMAYLKSKDLMQKDENGDIADRSYQALIKNKDGEYEAKPYIKAFKSEITAIIDELENFVDNLMDLEDEVYEAKWDYILYLQNLIKAFSEAKSLKLIKAWADVDRAWMKIKTPFQIGHPLEYYEDHFTKAVAPEWDLRLKNPDEDKNQRQEFLKSAFSVIFHSLEMNDKYDEHKKIFDFASKSLEKVSLFIGRPALFFGSEFNGLFSAQVVPNDENVSREEGKKIFAFADEILQITRAKPFLKLALEIFGQDFLSKQRKFIFQESKKWHQIYDITTIGHEYGHILWCAQDSSVVMNKHGNYKNIEEFKATTGGLVSFFISSKEQELKYEVLNDTIARAVGLISWMEVKEVEPYYCEGLIHLTGLFETEILSFRDKKLIIDLNEEKFEKIKSWYIKTYSNLALAYLDKKDANEFLDIYAIKEGKIFMPKDYQTRAFVEHYYARYKKIGQELDKTDKKENYLKD